MADDQRSASELRQYHDNGSIPNDQMSSSQIRARFGVPSNKKGRMCYVRVFHFFVN